VKYLTKFLFVKEIYRNAEKRGIINKYYFCLEDAEVAFLQRFGSLGLFILTLLQRMTGYNSMT